MLYKTKKLLLYNKKKTQIENKINSLQNDSDKQSQENKTVLKQTLAEFKKVHDQNKILTYEVESQNKKTNRLTQAVFLVPASDPRLV